MTTFSKPIALPNLKTLHTKPSWHNRAGRVDRSACFVITASQLWRNIPEDAWTYRYPARQPAYACKGKTDRHADLTLWARDLWELHRWENPYPLQGDFRTAKTNALRHTPRPIDQSGDRPCAQQMRQDNILGTGPTNPNRGVGFKLHKMLGLDCMWQTTIRIERIIQHHNLKQHFLICPVCGPRNDNPNPQARLAGRVTKLYLPLCTPQEYNDAQLAQHWLKSHPRNITHPNRPYTPEENQLINRYSELFDASTGRQLRCRQCLGLRYGEKKPPKAANGIGGLTRERAVIGKTADPIGGFEVARHLTEQQLFLTNLPKLLAKPRGKPRRYMLKASNRSNQANTTPNQSAINKHQSPATPIDALPESAKLELLRLFTAPLPAFKKLAKAK